MPTNHTLATGTSVVSDDVASPARRAARLRMPVLLLSALVGGFGLSAALTALLPASERLEVGEWVAIAAFAAAAIPLAVIDARTHRLPNRGTFPLAAGVLGYWIGLALTTGQWLLLAQASVTAAAIAAVTVMIALIGTLAAGDVKLMLAIGLLTGWFSWMLPVYAIVASYLLALPHATLILARRRARSGDTRLPFGPYLVAAAIAVTVVAKLVN